MDLADVARLDDQRGARAQVLVDQSMVHGRSQQEARDRGVRRGSSRDRSEMTTLTPSRTSVDHVVADARRWRWRGARAAVPAPCAAEEAVDGRRAKPDHVRLFVDVADLCAARRRSVSATGSTIW